jgi:hypothetical protein
VDRYESVVKSNGDIVGAVYVPLAPHSGILNQVFHLDSYRLPCDTNVLLGSPYLTCPAPHITEHLLVQGVKELL